MLLGSLTERRSIRTVSVDRIRSGSNPAYFVVREAWMSNTRIVIDIAPSAQLKVGQSVDVEGVMKTLDNGERAISPSHVRGYFDLAGRMFSFPIVKGMLAPLAWSALQELPAGIPGSGEPLPGEPTAPYVRCELLRCERGADRFPSNNNVRPDSCRRIGHICIRRTCERFQSVGRDRVSFSSRMAPGGIRVAYNGATQIAPGAIVDVSGILSTTTGGERLIDADGIGVTIKSSTGKIVPVGLSNRDLGGGEYNEYTPGITFPQPAYGLYNKGLLVKIWGVVTAVETANKCFYVDDGSAINNGEFGHADGREGSLVRRRWRGLGSERRRISDRCRGNQQFRVAKWRLCPASRSAELADAYPNRPSDRMESSSLAGLPRIGRNIWSTEARTRTAHTLWSPRPKRAAAGIPT